MPARAVDEGDVVRVVEPAAAARVHSRGLGRMQGGVLLLHPVEAAYAIETGRIDVGAGLAAFLSAHAGIEAAFLAYRDVRERGLLARPAEQGWHVWARGGGGEPWFTMHPAAEGDGARVADLAAWSSRSGVVSLVDEDGAVTHYLLERAAPRGEHTPPVMAPAAGQLLQDRVLVEGAAVAALRDAGLGTAVGDVQALSLAEAEHLRGLGLLDVPSPRRPGMARTVPVDADLRARGVLPKSGLRFGTHLRAYARGIDESHADWLVQCVRPDETLHWSEVSRAVRLAHGVRKQVLLGIVGDPVVYVALSWFRP